MFGIYRMATGFLLGAAATSIVYYDYIEEFFDVVNWVFAIFD